MELPRVNTCDLVRELAGREGVAVTTAEPHKKVEICVNGPAVVLVITD